MRTNSAESTLWSAELAARLRLLQADLADEAPDLREQALAGVVESALQPVPPELREAFLLAAADEFPAQVGARPVEAPPAPPAPAPLPEDPLALAKALTGMLPNLSAEQIEAVSGQLAEGGLLAAAAPGEPAVLPAELLQRLEKLAPGKPLDPRRALRALNVLLEFSLSLDQLVWQVWKAVAPKSVIHKGDGRFGDLRQCLGPYLTGDPEVSTEEVRQIVEKDRKLVAGLLGALGMVGETYAEKFLERLSPEAIREAAAAEPGVFIEVKCWRKYNAIFAEMNGPAIEKDVLNTIRKSTEKLILGADAATALEE